MKNISKPVLVILFLALAGCTRTEAQSGAAAAAEYRKISPAQAHGIMAGLNSYTLLDVRTIEEYRESRIEGAVLIPDFELQARAEKELPDKNTVILLYCRSGRRSENVARLLLRLGYTNVYDFGGIIDWPYETVSDL